MANESVDGASRAEKSHAEVRVEVTPGSRETEVISKKPLSQQPFRSASNAIREGLHNGRFFWTIEFIPSRDKILHDELHKLGGIAGVILEDPLLAGFAVTDRVVSDRDPDPAAAASHLLDVSGKQPLVHFSGKGREVQHLHEFLSRLHENGLKNVLMLTGDRLKEEPKDRRPRYLESVPAIQLAKQIDPDLFVAAALNPFKYREEDAMAQYLKLGKKVGAGADCIITQLGFDMLKYEEAVYWMGREGYRLPIMIQRPAHVGATCALHPGSPASRGDRDRLFYCAPRRRGTNARGPGRGSGAPPPRTTDTWGAVLRVCGGADHGFALGGKGGCVTSAGSGVVRTVSGLSHLEEGLG